MCDSANLLTMVVGSPKAIPLGSTFSFFFNTDCLVFSQPFLCRTKSYFILSFQSFGSKIIALAYAKHVGTLYLRFVVERTCKRRRIDVIILLSLCLHVHSLLTYLHRKSRIAATAFHIQKTIKIVFDSWSSITRHIGHCSYRVNSMCRQLNKIHFSVFALQRYDPSNTRQLDHGQQFFATIQSQQLQSQRLRHKRCSLRQLKRPV